MKRIFRPRSCLAALSAALILLGAGTARVWTAPYIRGAIPLDPTAAVWAKATANVIPLSPQVITTPNGGGATPSVSVKAVHNGTEIAFLMEWSDETVDTVVGSDSYRDACALMFPANPKQPVSPFMGQEGGRVMIWQWKADWQAKLDGDDRTPQAYSDFHNPEDDLLFGKIGNRPNAGSSVEELMAEGFGTLTSRKNQTVLGRGVNAGGKWKVVFIRRMGDAEPDNAAFAPGDTIQVNVAVWNGSAKEVSAKKSVSMAWHPLILGKLKAVPKSKGKGS